MGRTGRWADNPPHYCLSMDICHLPATSADILEPLLWHSEVNNSQFFYYGPIYFDTTLVLVHILHLPEIPKFSQWYCINLVNRVRPCFVQSLKDEATVLQCFSS